MVLTGACTGSVVLADVCYSGSWDGDGSDYLLGSHLCTLRGVILFANHKANGVVTNIGLLANTVDDTGSYMAG